MGVFTQHGPALEWQGSHETVRVEPWGTSSLRVRGTIWQGIRDDLPGALLPAPAAAAAVEVSAGGARISNGTLTAITGTATPAAALAQAQSTISGIPQVKNR